MKTQSAHVNRWFERSSRLRAIGCLALAPLVWQVFGSTVTAQDTNKSTPATQQPVMQQPAAQQPATQQPAAQQPATPSTPSTSAELMEGLLDLLNEPAVPKKEPPAQTPLTPADLGLDGEDLGEDPENPLQAVRQSMLIAAAYLGRDGANAETMKLQSDIVRRLDDLISELEKSQAAQKPSKDQEEQKSGAKPKQQQQNQAGSSKQTAKSKPGESRDGDESQERSRLEGEPENPPTQKGSAGGVSVELSDPKALQQDVWGQLPSRVRQQMQSRMVEQFLPAYREQIEAYFQALLK